MLSPIYCYGVDCHGVATVHVQQWLFKLKAVKLFRVMASTSDAVADSLVDAPLMGLLLGYLTPEREENFMVQGSRGESECDSRTLSDILASFQAECLQLWRVLLL